MPSKFYCENWSKANEWLNTHAPKYVLDACNEAFNLMSRHIERREELIEFFYKVIEKYLGHLPEEAKQELIAYHQSQQLISKMIKNAKTNT